MIAKAFEAAGAMRATAMTAATTVGTNILIPTGKDPWISEPKPGVESHSFVRQLVHNT